MTANYLHVGPNGDIWLNDEMLIVMYPEGDCDVVNKKMDGFKDHLHHALYDTYQCSEYLAEGDQFFLAGKLIARCEGVHVVMVA